MDATDLASLVNSTDDEPTVQARAQALATALRGQQQQAQQRQFLGSLGGLTGSEGLANVGADFSRAAAQQYADAGKGLEQLQALPQTRLKLALERQQLTKDQRENQTAADRTAALADPNSLTTKIRNSLAPRFGITVPDGSPGNAVDDEELKLAEKAQEAEENRKSREVMARLTASTRERTQGEKEEQFNTKREDALSGKLADVLNPYKARGGLKNYADAINRAGKIENLLVDPKTGQLHPIVDNRQMAELAMSLQQLVSAGHGSQAEVEKLIPKTAGSKLADLEEYFLNKPMDAGQQAFAQQMLHSARVEAETNKAQMDRAMVNQLPSVLGSLRGLGDKARARADSQLKGAGFNPEAFDDNGLPVEGKDVSLGSASARQGGAAPPPHVPGAIRIEDAKGRRGWLAPGAPMPKGAKAVTDG